LNFSVIDLNLADVNYSLNKGMNTTFLEPFEISTEGWVDEVNMIQINAIDIPRNSNSSWFTFTIDSTPPSIYFDPNLNHSTLRVGESIQLNIFDSNLKDVIFSLDDGDYYSITSPFIIDTSEWSNGLHSFTIKANDSAGNEVIRWLEVTIDALPPYIVSTIPTDKSKDIEINTSISITFSESMNQTDVENYIYIFPLVDFSLQWDLRVTVLTISFIPNNLTENRTYVLTIDSPITDINGNSMSNDFTLEFTTKAEPQSTEPQPSPDSDTSFPLWILSLIATLTAILIILLLLVGKKRRGETEEDEVPKNEDEEEEESPDKESSHHEESIAKTSWKLKCPKCKKIFRIVGEKKPAFAKCPKCGKRWRMPE
jgi:hypothetical protein